MERGFRQIFSILNVLFSDINWQVLMAFKHAVFHFVHVDLHWLASVNVYRFESTASSFLFPVVYHLLAHIIGVSHRPSRTKTDVTLISSFISWRFEGTFADDRPVQVISYIQVAHI
jgi:hypothetical protein